MIRTALALLAVHVLLVPGGAGASSPPLAGTWQGPMGAVRFAVTGTAVKGTLAESKLGVPFASRSEVLKGTLLGDTLAVQVRVPVSGCRKREVWAAGMLLLGMNGNLLSGAVHVPPGCKASLLGATGGLAIRRVPDDLVIEALAELREEKGSGVTAVSRAQLAGEEPKPRKALPKEASAAEVGERGVEEATFARIPLGYLERRARPDPGVLELRRAQARTVIGEGAAYLQEGRFEQARAKFLEAIRVDPTVPEAYNGVGVSHYGRQEHAEAERWYRRALSVDPDFGDAYYNLACLHALGGRKDAAFRLLELAVRNGYTTDDSLDHDPDLAGLRDDPRFAKLRGKKRR